MAKTLTRPKSPWDRPSPAMAASDATYAFNRRPFSRVFRSFVEPRRRQRWVELTRSPSHRRMRIPPSTASFTKVKCRDRGRGGSGHGAISPLQLWKHCAESGPSCTVPTTQIGQFRVNSRWLRAPATNLDCCVRKPRRPPPELFCLLRNSKAAESCQLRAQVDLNSAFVLYEPTRSAP
jgi:hypothetical protein